MPFVRVTNSSVELIGDDFAVKRTIATSARSADRNSKGTSLVVHTDGRVVLYNDDAATVRTITSGGQSAVFSGDDLIIRKVNGKTEVWTQSGSLIRTMDSGMNIKQLTADLQV